MGEMSTLMYSSPSDYEDSAGDAVDVAIIVAEAEEGNPLWLYLVSILNGWWER